MPLRAPAAGSALPCLGKMRAAAAEPCRYRGFAGACLYVLRRRPPEFQRVIRATDARRSSARARCSKTEQKPHRRSRGQAYARHATCLCGGAAWLRTRVEQVRRPHRIAVAGRMCSGAAGHRYRTCITAAPQPHRMCIAPRSVCVRRAARCVAAASADTDVASPAALKQQV